MRSFCLSFMLIMLLFPTKPRREGSCWGGRAYGVGERERVGYWPCASQDPMGHRLPLCLLPHRPLPPPVSQQVH